MVSSTAGDTMTYAFTGDTLTIYRHLDTNGGQAGVTIDGKPWGTILFFHSSDSISKSPRKMRRATRQPVATSPSRHWRRPLPPPSAA